MHIVLMGDSILDNSTYVEEGQSVIELLNSTLPHCKTTLLAVDGSLTTDINTQLEEFPQSATHIFLSCGGNDAIENIDVLSLKTDSVEDALVLLSKRVESFRQCYQSAIDAVCKKHTNVAGFTVYNKIPGLAQLPRQH